MPNKFGWIVSFSYQNLIHANIRNRHLYICFYLPPPSSLQTPLAHNQIMVQNIKYTSLNFKVSYCPFVTRKKYYYMLEDQTITRQEKTPSICSQGHGRHSFTWPTRRSPACLGTSGHQLWFCNWFGPEEVKAESLAVWMSNVFVWFSLELGFGLGLSFGLVYTWTSKMKQFMNVNYFLSQVNECLPKV